MQRAALPVIVALIFLVLMLYYLIPGISHPLVSSDPMGSHYKHALLFLGLAVLSGIWARFAVSGSRRG